MPAAMQTPQFRFWMSTLFYCVFLVGPFASLVTSISFLSPYPARLPCCIIILCRATMLWQVACQALRWCISIISLHRVKGDCQII